MTAGAAGLLRTQEPWPGSAESGESSSLLPEGGEERAAAPADEASGASPWSGAGTSKGTAEGCERVCHLLNS